MQGYYASLGFAENTWPAPRERNRAGAVYCRYGNNDLQTGQSMKWTLPGTLISSPGLLLCLLTGPGLTHAQSPGQLEAGLFSSSRPGASLPDGWQPLTFSRIPRHTDYSLVEEDGTVVIKAVSEQSASGLVRKMSIDPSAYPLIQWRWKVNNVLQKGDVTRKDGDDYAARIYITFAFDPERASYLERLKYETARFVRGEDLPYRAISYIRGSNSQAGSMVANAYTDAGHDVCCRGRRCKHAALGDRTARCLCGLQKGLR